MLDEQQHEQFLKLLPADISPAFKDILRKEAKFVVLQKGETLIEKPSNPKVYYILKGGCVGFIVSPTADERVVMFHTEEFLPVVGSMYVNKENSVVNYAVKATEKTELIEFNVAINNVVKKDISFDTFLFQKHIQLRSITNQLHYHLIGLSNEDFFQWLLKNYGFIFQRFLSKDIASFIGITPVWLSHLKQNYFKH